MGDVFQNIHNSTIINNSILKCSFNKVTTERDKEVSNALIQIAEFILKSGDPAAGASTESKSK